MLRLTDLREILRYVPGYRDRLFVIALDGAVVADEHFHNLLIDVALLRSLRVRVLLVHGAGYQVRRLAAQTGITPSNFDGVGPTDAMTLQLSIDAATRVTHEVLQGLAAHDLRGAASNALVAHPAGILHGVDHLFTGRIERIDTALLQSLLDNDILPVLPPLGIDGEGRTYRLNSDEVAVEVAGAMRAVKLIYLTQHEGIHRGTELLRQLSVDEAEAILKKQPAEVPAEDVSKLENAVRAARAGVPRVHIVDCRVEEGLLAEVFSHEGVGTLIHVNEYQAIRKAVKKDARAIHALIKPGMEKDEFLRRSKMDIEKQIEDFHVFCVDRMPVACVAVHFYPTDAKAEMAALCVDSRYENMGIGAKLIRYAEEVARAGGARQLLCLSTQAYNYFQQKGGFQLGSPDDLPPLRRERYDRSGRNSMVLTKAL
jgi:amino-acid N-acetyltransferase